jgi:NAD(P)-dependent dehydrogenase (short-subunit alcohol dehydrogenase family)
MQNKTVFITGASSGIGKATAIYFSRMTWNVVASLRNPENEKELTALQNVLLVKLDVTDETSIILALAQALERFGKIDVLVNNAGYGSLGSFESATQEQLKRQFDTNVLGLMAMTRNVLPHFRANKSGVIINIASIAGRLGFPMFSVYNSSKFAVEGFSESLRFELEPFGIKVKIVEPGPIKTDFYTRSMDLFDAESIQEYKGLVKQVADTMIQSGIKAEGPEIVAKTIFKAATSTGKKLRYPVGGGAPVLMIVKWILPDCLLRAIVRMALGMK